MASAPLPMRPLALPSRAPYVLLEDSRAGDGLLFEAPVRRFVATDADGAHRALEGMERALADGLHVAGYASYELGYLFEQRLEALLPQNPRTPLIQMAAFRAPCRGMPPLMEGIGVIHAARPVWSRRAYADRFQKVKDYIAAGDVYQVNLTFPFDVECSGAPAALHARFRASQPVAHGAIVALGDPTVLSWSPELFFRIADGTVSSRPMKGTSRRGRSPEEDRRLAAELAADPKQRAENLMIVDLIRNDIGRMSEIGSVRVPDLFRVETYPTLHTMTSTVEGRIRAGLTARDIFRALFPCGSITGAPKIRAMQIIHELEHIPRGAYCGGIGYFAPDGTACFNVAIRTLSVFDRGPASYAAGGGVIYDSQADAEYDECLLKAKFLLGAISG
ncbi:MAG: aminodeoxychorismate synthase component I [Hyphomicrobium sp.]|nr:aminodeoxychorismate synthase component I [Hyphomicrobium sp.]